MSIDLRQPALSRLLWMTSLVVAAGLVVFAFSIGGDAVFQVFFVVMVIAITVVNSARALSRVTSTADRALVVRNFFRTRVLRPSDIDRVVVGRQGGPGTLRRLELLLTNGSTLHLTATESLPLPGATSRLEAQAAELRAWAGLGPRASA